MKLVRPHDPWNQAMRRGDFESAWRETDKLEALRRRQPPGACDLLWNGDNPHGRNVLVRCLHGLGDTIQFSRFLSPLNEIAAQLSVLVQPPLVPLFQNQSGFGIVRNGWTEWGNTDSALEIEIMELAYAFRVNPATLPLPRLCVSGESRRSDPILDLLQTSARKIAIFWAASGWGGGRHVPFSFFEPLADFSGVQFFSFQQGPCEREAEESVLPIHRISEHTADIRDLARALAEMDLVLTVDTMAAHLAGSLRIPAWLLLERMADWRWIEGRDDSPWYPEMRVFREHRGWEEVIGEILRELETTGLQR
jgi:hypothetical protein